MKRLLPICKSSDILQIVRYLALNDWIKTFFKLIEENVISLF